MIRAKISADQVAVNRILRAGFNALVEYDSLGQVVGSAGGLSSGFAWARVAQFAFSGQNPDVAEKATAILLGDMLIAALAVQGGGTLLAVAERQVLAQVADDLARALDRAVAGVLGEKLAPWAVFAGVVTLVYFTFRIPGSGPRA
jgi:hypothetical protein